MRGMPGKILTRLQRRDKKATRSGCFQSDRVNEQAHFEDQNRSDIPSSRGRRRGFGRSNRASIIFPVMKDNTCADDTILLFWRLTTTI